MVEEGVTENIQDNEGESIAIQDKSDKMVENKKVKEVKLIEEEEEYLIQTQHSSSAALQLVRRRARWKKCVKKNW
jgi:hypothetical protein